MVSEVWALVRQLGHHHCDEHEKGQKHQCFELELASFEEGAELNCQQIQESALYYFEVLSLEIEPKINNKYRVKASGLSRFATSAAF